MTPDRRHIQPLSVSAYVSILVDVLFVYVLFNQSILCASQGPEAENEADETGAAREKRGSRKQWGPEKISKTIERNAAQGNAGMG
jgi:hypothetical protein